MNRLVPTWTALRAASLLVLLTALSAALAGCPASTAPQREPDKTLALLEQALAQWEKANARPMTYGEPDLPRVGDSYEIIEDIAAGDGDDHLITRRVLFRLMSEPSSKAIVASIDPAFLKRDADSTRPADLQQFLVDPWGREYLVIFPGRTYVPTGDLPGTFLDADGTVRTFFEQRYGVCVDNKPAFVSAGPDGDFGTVDLGSPTPAPTAAIADNVYSRPLKTSLP
jgi:hypothetical protein